MMVLASETNILENLSNDEITDNKFAEIIRIEKNNKVLFFFCVYCY